MVSYYDQGREASRLEGGSGPLEFVRTQEILRRHLPRPPGFVLDVGGASGVHAAWLARDGYSVHVVDPIELHVEQARAAAAAQPSARFTAALGDARALDQQQASADAVLLLEVRPETRARDLAFRWSRSKEPPSTGVSVFNIRAARSAEGDAGDGPHEPQRSGRAFRPHRQDPLRGCAIVAGVGRVAVLGSLNMDLVVRVHALPKPGNTVLGDRLLRVQGGKG